MPVLPTPDRTKVGVLLPTREIAITGSYDLASVLAFARRAEDIGYDSLWVGDSLLARPRPDALVVLAAVSSLIHRAELGSACLIPALRDPVVGAGVASSLHQAIGDRLILGLGSGFPIPLVEREFAAVGVPFDQRVGRLDETLRLWRQAWHSHGDPDAGDFAGRYADASGLDRLVPPATAGGPRVWYAGGDTPWVMSRVARLYDGWLPFLPTPEAYAEAWSRIRELAAEAGRPEGAVFPAMYATISVDTDRDRARDALEDYVQHYYGYPLEITSMVQAFRYGTVEECAAELARYVVAGARHLVIRIGSLAPDPPLREILHAVRAAIRDVSPTAPVPAAAGLTVDAA
jgi:alkanesulfonate monooxygenase SsuD/methylene tetrahydromethanopterin reductase-like flavin-dependent oxidoreductase (luciferase family)